MKKLLTIISIFTLIGAISVTATPVLIQNKPLTAGNGSFTGEIGYSKNKEWIQIGELSGSYEQKNKFYRFQGDWQVTVNDTTVSGKMLGGFGRHILIGKITITESGKKAPIIGFIGFNETTSTFFGRFMSVIGPALYFKGTYQ